MIIKCARAKYKYNCYTKQYFFYKCLKKHSEMYSMRYTHIVKFNCSMLNFCNNV